MVRDIDQVIPASQFVTVTQMGDFIFLKSANKNIIVEIDGDSVEMQPGDSLIFDGRPFFSFKVTNNNNVSVTAKFVSGIGRFVRPLKAL